VNCKWSSIETSYVLAAWLSGCALFAVSRATGRPCAPDEIAVFATFPGLAYQELEMASQGEFLGGFPF
jgi:hypothetical protein